MEEQTLSPELYPLIIDHMNFARKLAKSFYRERRNGALSYEDVEGAAFLGLCDAARRFDPKRGMEFRTFSYFRVRGAMFDLVRKGGGISRNHFASLAADRSLTNAKDAKEDINEKPGEKEFSVGEKEPLPYTFARTAQELSSLSTIVEQAGIRVHLNNAKDDVEISYSEQNNPEDEVTLENSKNYIKKLLRRLPKREREVVELRFLEEYTTEELLEKYTGMSRSWLSRIQARALDRIRNSVEKDERGCEAELLSATRLIDNS